MITQLARALSFFFFFLLSLPSCDLLLDLWLTHRTVSHDHSWQLLSVLRSVGGKSLCSMKLQRAGDIFSKKKKKILNSYMSRKTTIKLARNKFLYNRNR